MTRHRVFDKTHYENKTRYCVLSARGLCIDHRDQRGLTGSPGKDCDVWG